MLEFKVKAVDPKRNRDENIPKETRIGSKVNISGITWPNNHIALLSTYSSYFLYRSLILAKWKRIQGMPAIKQASSTVLPHLL